jgi:hypothetical protein
MSRDITRERATGIEPAFSAWEADVLPLNYARWCGTPYWQHPSAILVGGAPGGPAGGVGGARYPLRMFGGSDKAPLGERLKNALLKPANPQPMPATDETPSSVEELEAAVRSADDKERLIGLLAAPIAAMIGFAITSLDISNDPASGSKHVNPSTYYELELVLLALAFVMLVMAMRRKRLFIGMAMALYGLTVFNLHYWGFGVPFILFASWYLVRSYRLSRDLRLATEGSAEGRAPRASKRYTPPTRPKRLPPASD